MSLVNPESLAETAGRIHHAHFFGERITKRDAKEARAWLLSRSWQDIPESIRNAANPNPRWASVPASFNLTATERRTKPATFTGERLANASLRMVHSREAARALFVLDAVLGDTTPDEALSLCRSVRDAANGLREARKALYCCGPCTVSVFRLAGIGADVADEGALRHLLSALPKHRDGSGAWRRFPFFYTLLALLDLDRPTTAAELRYALPACERKRKGLGHADVMAARRAAVLDRVLEAAS